MALESILLVVFNEGRIGRLASTPLFMRGHLFSDSYEPGTLLALNLLLHRAS